MRIGSLLTANRQAWALQAKAQERAQAKVPGLATAPATGNAAPASATDLDATPGTRTYTLRSLLEAQFGVSLSASGQGATTTTKTPTSQKVDASKLKTGDRLSLGQVQASSIQVTQVSAQTMTLSAQIGDQRLEISATRVSVTSLRVDSVTVQEQDPLVLDMAGDGISLRGLGDGVKFDIDGDGSGELSGFVQGDDALVVLDRAGDGLIGGEDLVGARAGSGGGFGELAEMDGNGDGRVDAADAAYGKLRIFQDANRDGKATAGELTGLAEAGIVALNVASREVAQTSGDQRIVEAGSFVRADGSAGEAVDVLFKYREV